jgi:hypothetical protein
MDDTVRLTNEIRDLTNEIRDKLDAGLLPLAVPVRIFCAHGHGDSCKACERPVVPAQLEYRFPTQDDADKPLHFHFHCFGLWLVALRRRGIDLGPIEVQPVEVQEDDGVKPESRFEWQKARCHGLASWLASVVHVTWMAVTSPIWKCRDRSV